MMSGLAYAGPCLLTPFPDQIAALSLSLPIQSQLDVNRDVISFMMTEWLSKDSTSIGLTFPPSVDWQITV